MADFASIDKPTVQERLSYWARQVRKSMDNGSAFLSRAQHAAWFAKHLPVALEYEKAISDARHRIHTEGDPLWKARKDAVQGDTITWDAAVNQADASDKLCWLLEVLELHDKDNDSPVEQTPEQIKLSAEVGIAENACFNGRKWD